MSSCHSCLQLSTVPVLVANESNNWFALTHSHLFPTDSRYTEQKTGNNVSKFTLKMDDQILLVKF